MLPAATRSTSGSSAGVPGRLPTTMPAILSMRRAYWRCRAENPLSRRVPRIVRRPCGAEPLRLLGSAPVRREEAGEVARIAAQRAVRLRIVHGLADRHRALTARVEALLEPVQRVAAAADAAAQVEARVALVLRPQRDVVEQQRRGTEFAPPIRRGAEVIVQKRRRSEAEGTRDHVCLLVGLEAHEPVAEPVECIPVRARKEVEACR